MRKASDGGGGRHPAPRLWQAPTTTLREAPLPASGEDRCRFLHPFLRKPPGNPAKAIRDDFRESPARLVAATLARRFGNRITVVEPCASALPIEFTDTGASWSISTPRSRAAAC